MLLHLSDLHFGTEQPAVCAALLRLCHDLQPEAVVVSGDLTQRARPEQFAAARAFLDQLSPPILVVPGNHDIPLFDVKSRLLRPFARFQAQFEALEPTLTTAHFHVVGVNSVTRHQHTRGSISPWQIIEAGSRLAQAPHGRTAVLVSHQPFVVTDPNDRDEIPRLARPAVQHWVKQGARAFLHGHLHQPVVVDLNHAWGLDQPHAVLDIQAGTGLSSRLRQDCPNAVNLITPALEVIEYRYVAALGQFKARGLLWPPAV